MGDLNDLYHDLNEQGIQGKPRKLKDKILEPSPFCSSTVHYLLSNPTYIGKVRHKDQIYEGQHEPIVPVDLWQSVQDRLISQSVTIRNHRKHHQKNVLRKLLFDNEDRPYMPAYTNKPGKQYRYYKLKEKTVAEDVLDRIPAHEIENRVEEAIRQELSDFDKVAGLLGIDQRHNPDLIQMIIQKQTCITGKDLVIAATQKVIVDQQSITVRVKTAALSAFIAEHLRIGIPQPADETRELKISYITRRAHRGAIMIDVNKDSSEKNPLDLPSGETRNLIRGLIWRDEHFAGMTLRDIGKREGFSEGYVGKCIFRSLSLYI